MVDILTANAWNDGSQDDKFSARGDLAYIPDERRRAALAEVDSASFSLFHAKVCFVAGVGFFTDAYDIFAINIASHMLGYVYGQGQKLSKSQEMHVKVATPVGTLVSQLLFGWLADRIGRKKMYGVELVIIVISTFAQALSGSAAAINIISVLIFWRFVMGVGIGGDHPLSAVISSEFASTKIRGRMMTAVFAAQGWGNLAAAIVALVITASYRTDILQSKPDNGLQSIDHMWRLLIGLGCVPGTIALYFRLTISETPRFTMDIERNIEQASHDISNTLNEQKMYHDPGGVTRFEAPKASLADFKAYFGQRKNFKILFGTAYSWFALDIAFYGLGLNSSIILDAIGLSRVPSKNVNESVYNNLSSICIGNIILSVAGFVPGYWVSFLFIDSWGRKPIQLMGFIILTLLFLIMGFAYENLSATDEAKKVFVFLFCLVNFFQNFGPNTTTFIIPGEIFPTRYRSTAHGISAASGKLGAIVAQVSFTQLKDIGGENQFVKHILHIFSFFMFTGIFSTLLLPETKGRSLEELSNEDQDGFVKGRVNGNPAPVACTCNCQGHHPNSSQ